MDLPRPPRRRPRWWFAIAGVAAALVVVTLSGLPRAARPDLSVDAVIEIERLDDVLRVARPVLVQPGRAASLFKIDRRGGEAVRVRVELGSAPRRTARSRSRTDRIDGAVR